MYVIADDELCNLFETSIKFELPWSFNDSSHSIIYIKIFDLKCGASDNVTDSSVLSNPADAQDVSCLGLSGRDICPKSCA